MDDDGKVLVVVVDRVGTKSGHYQVVGRAKCCKCFETCLLGRLTMKRVKDEMHFPLCRQCARELIADGRIPAEPIAQVIDPPKSKIN